MMKRTLPITALVSLFLVVMALSACSEEEAKMSSESTVDYGQVALAFTQSLAAREYEKAYEMTSEKFRRGTSIEQLRSAFEEIVPSNWGPTEPVEIGQTMTNWPDKQVSDLGWAYVSIYGDVYSEAVTVIVALEHGESKVRQVEFGRP